MMGLRMTQNDWYQQDPVKSDKYCALNRESKCCDECSWYRAYGDIHCMLIDELHNIRGALNGGIKVGVCK